MVTLRNQRSIRNKLKIRKIRGEYFMRVKTFSQNRSQLLTRNSKQHHKRNILDSIQMNQFFAQNRVFKQGSTTIPRRTAKSVAYAYLMTSLFSSGITMAQQASLIFFQSRDVMQPKFKAYFLDHSLTHFVHIGSNCCLRQKGALKIQIQTMLIILVGSVQA
ncbi:hypothetical protein FGO68_gene12727 [Halteria grandinella]|uniref:Uncharacterized protein n=1 Tax=Halteria grandinella TaxID=5974 RepID=A0A8J8T8R4_HALGN|nr:hypothetical protein FGO68_gene12727 [Halteria grandinella]